MAIQETIDSSIEELAGQLVTASDEEALRIRNRIRELKALKAEHTTT